MKLYLVRHAKAGERGAWPGDDRLRPLSRRGQLQSEGLIAVFDDRKVERILSSSYVRCLETMVPLARMVSFLVIWSALITPLRRDPLAARPEGTWTKMAGSMAAAASP